MEFLNKSPQHFSKKYRRRKQIKTFFFEGFKKKLLLEFQQNLAIEFFKEQQTIDKGTTKDTLEHISEKKSKNVERLSKKSGNNFQKLSTPKCPKFCETSFQKLPKYLPQIYGIFLQNANKTITKKNLNEIAGDIAEELNKKIYNLVKEFRKNCRLCSTAP